MKPSYGLTDEQVEKMIQESFEKAEQDFDSTASAGGARGGRCDSGGVEKARKHDAYFELTDEERAAIDKAINELLLVYHADDHLLIAAKIEQLNQATHQAGREHDEHGVSAQGQI